MITDEKKIFRYIDLGFYLIFVPIILVLIPTDKFLDHDPVFFAILMVYMAIIHFINRKFNPLTLFFSKKPWAAIGSIAATVIISLVMAKVEVTNMRSCSIHPEISAERVAEIKQRAIGMLFTLDMSFAIMVGLVLELFKQIRHRQNVEVEKNKAEIALYKSQINPHFMFNTLNTLYGLYITESEKTSEVFIKFSEIIKYMYVNTEKEKTPLCDEIAYLKQFIELHTLRLGSQTNVELDIDVKENEFTIPPMVLITFVENCFKYGVSSTTPSTIKIALKLSENSFTFKATNSIFPRKEPSSGIGISNCRKRLELLYPSKYCLECTTEENIFRVVLKIKL